ncbi:hypothetical protein ACWD01_08185 [Streptomyces sp. NPDC002835]
MTGNSAGYGGGIFNIPDSHLDLIDSTVSGNVAGEAGGIRFDDSGTVTNSTIADNRVTDPGDRPGSLGGYGGGIDIRGLGPVEILNSTITGNRSSDGGGGINIAPVDQLNRYRPVLLSGYATVIALLAGEQLAGRLRIAPAVVSLVAEGLGDREHRRIRSAFGAHVVNSYACNESLALGYGCPFGWLHTHSDWLILEPVDADHRPVPPGQESFTVLLTSLGRWVQPILRYDLGDSVLLRPDPCPCGDPLPAVKVRGRAADLLSFPRRGGGTVRIVPMAFETLLESLPDIDLFQIVQTTATTLRVRIRPAAGADQERLWNAVRTGLCALLTDHRTDRVRIERAHEPPEQSPGGKYRVVIPCP